MKLKKKSWIFIGEFCLNPNLPCLLRNFQSLKNLSKVQRLVILGRFIQNSADIV